MCAGTGTVTLSLSRIIEIHHANGVTSVHVVVGEVEEINCAEWSCRLSVSVDEHQMLNQSVFGVDSIQCVILALGLAVLRVEFYATEIGGWIPLADIGDIRPLKPHV